MNLSEIKEILELLQSQVSYLEEQDKVHVIDRDSFMFKVRELYDACMKDVSIASTKEAETARLALIQKEQEAEALKVKVEAEAKKQAADRLRLQEIEAEQQRLANEKQLELEAKKLAEAKRLVEEERLKQEAIRLAEEERLKQVAIAKEIELRKKNEAENKLKIAAGERIKQAQETKRLETEKAERIRQELEAKKRKEIELQILMEAEMKRQKEQEEILKENEQKEVLNGSQFAEEYEPLFVFKKGNSISEKIARQPVADLFKAFSVNDKILFTKELFLGDAGAFDAALKEINEATNFEAVRAYLETTLIESNDWMDKTRQPRAKEFILLARRRHL